MKVEHDRIKTADIVESVKFNLDHTFRNPERIVENAPFELDTNGWGTFRIPIEIRWKKHLKMPAKKLAHHLSFADDDQYNTCIVKIHKDMIFKDEQEE